MISRYAGRSRRATSHLDAWRSDPSKADVVSLVEGHDISVLYALSPPDVIGVCERTEHALVDVRK